MLRLDTVLNVILVLKKNSRGYIVGRLFINSLSLDKIGVAGTAPLHVNSHERLQFTIEA